MGLLQSTDDDQKPLYRKWIKTLKRGEDIPALKIDSMRLSGSGEWIILETKECVALLNAESTVGQNFWQFAQQLEGKLKSLTLIPAKGKLGFDVEPGEDLGDWEQISDDEIEFSDSKSKKSKAQKLGKLTLAAMQPVTPTSVNIGKETKKGNGGTGSTTQST